MHNSFTLPIRPLPVAKILIIEDDLATAEGIAAALLEVGLEPDIVGDGRLGLERALSGNYHAITLDRMLPEMDGVSVVAALRSAGCQSPVLMLSALGEVDDRIAGLRAGGDDYLIKPFDPQELAARVEVLLRRQRRTDKGGRLVKSGILELDLVSREVTLRGHSISLQETESKLLEFLMRNSGQLLTRAMIFEAVWGYRFDPGTNVIDVHLARLRRKLEAAGAGPLIHTVRGAGFRLDAPA
ncbi:TPA: response regulator transcription factor [Stenotrophomonas maltophilia]|uniref:response regulator transcription factor n=1 Tax=Stenotrophomonas maltophilia TaxID=40324 RepID=UPI001312EF04|nr:MULTISPECIES: response regulator transcription factor [Stenotrophomonas]MCO7496897.1 response regulator transcription factor [Stenotrophomonas maltophilia]